MNLINPVLFIARYIRDWYYDYYILCLDFYCNMTWSYYCMIINYDSYYDHEYAIRWIHVYVFIYISLVCMHY